MANDSTDRMFRRVPTPAGPAGFDVREVDLSAALHRHVQLRDACLAPSALIESKLSRLDVDHWHRQKSTTHHTDDVADLVGRVSVVAQMAEIRRSIRDLGALLPSERRRLVLLDVLAATPDAPDADTPWSRDPVALVGEAATGVGHSPSDIRRLARKLTIARTALPPVEIGPSTTRALAESMRRVVGITPGAAVAQSVLLLSDRMPVAWSPSACGAVLLDPGPQGLARFVGTLVARHDLAAFVDDLATLRVAADVSPTVARYASVLLPDLADELRHHRVLAQERHVMLVAADLTMRTAALLDRGFRPFDRAKRQRRFLLAA